MGKRVTRPSERYELRTAMVPHKCFGRREEHLGKVYGENCSEVIQPGERYLINTIFPGHESGRCDGYRITKHRWNHDTKKFETYYEEVLGKPITRNFCLNCAKDWEDLNNALEELLGAAA